MTIKQWEVAIGSANQCSTIASRSSISTALLLSSWELAGTSASSLFIAASIELNSPASCCGASRSSCGASRSCCRPSSGGCSPGAASAWHVGRKKNTKEINRLEEIFWGQVLVGQETSTKKSYIFCAKSSYISNRILVILHLILFRPLLVPWLLCRVLPVLPATPTPWPLLPCRLAIPVFIAVLPRLVSMVPIPPRAILWTPLSLHSQDFWAFQRLWTKKMTIWSYALKSWKKQLTEYTSLHRLPANEPA